MADAPDGDLPLLTRVALLEARMRLVVLVLKGAVAVIATSLIAFFFGYH
jgi:NifU-like protein involved in Fe-S cluster formation